MTMTVRQLAKRVGIAPHVIRYYTRRGLLNPVRDPENGYRRFGEADVRRLEFIRLAQGAGCRLEDIALILNGLDNQSLSDAWLRSRWQQRLDDMQSRFIKLARQKRALEQVLDHCVRFPPQVGDVQSLSVWIRRALKAGKLDRSIRE